jgi:hypothetical protein
VPVTSEQEAATFNDITVVVGGATTQIIPAAISGTLEGADLFVNVSATTGNSTVVFWKLVDGNSNTIVGGQFGGLPGGSTGYIAYNNGNLRRRFQNGLSFVQSTAVNLGGGLVAINVYYRTP